MICAGWKEVRVNVEREETGVFLHTYFACIHAFGGGGCKKGRVKTGFLVLFGKKN